MEKYTPPILSDIDADLKTIEEMRLMPAQFEGLINALTDALNSKGETDEI